MAATFTALNAAPAFLTGRKVVSKARAGPAPRAPFQVSAAATSSRPLWAPGASLWASKEPSETLRSELDLEEKNMTCNYCNKIEMQQNACDNDTIRVELSMQMLEFLL